MKRAFILLLCLTLLFSTVACGSEGGSVSQPADAPAPQSVPQPEQQDKPPVSEDENPSSEMMQEEQPVTEAPQEKEPPEVAYQEEKIATESSEGSDDLYWQRMESLGNVTVEDGIPYVIVTMRNDEITGNFFNYDMPNAADRCTSIEAHFSYSDYNTIAIKMNRSQYSNMLTWLKERIDTELQALCDNPDIGVERIEHNENMTVFDVYAPRERVDDGIYSVTYSIAYYSGFYASFTGYYNYDPSIGGVPDATINVYDMEGKLIEF